MQHLVDHLLSWPDLPYQVQGPRSPPQQWPSPRSWWRPCRLHIIIVLLSTQKTNNLVGHLTTFLEAVVDAATLAIKGVDIELLGWFMPFTPCMEMGLNFGDVLPDPKSESFTQKD